MKSALMKLAPSNFFSLSISSLFIPSILSQSYIRINPIKTGPFVSKSKNLLMVVVATKNNSREKKKE